MGVRAVGCKQNVLQNVYFFEPEKSPKNTTIPYEVGYTQIDEETTSLLFSNNLDSYDDVNVDQENFCR